MCKKFVSLRQSKIKPKLSINTMNTFPETNLPGLYTVPRCSLTKEEKQRFPNLGWIKPCHTKECRIPTSRFIIINKKFKFYFCTDCQKYQRYQFVLNDFLNITYLESNIL